MVHSGVVIGGEGENQMNDQKLGEKFCNNIIRCNSLRILLVDWAIIHKPLGLHGSTVFISQRSALAAFHFVTGSDNEKTAVNCTASKRRVTARTRKEVVRATILAPIFVMTSGIKAKTGSHLNDP